MEKTVVGVLFLFILVSCKKEGIGGKSGISGNSMHHERQIPGLRVFVSYGSKVFPSNKKFDDSLQLPTNSSNFSFSGLQKGDYYIYARGMDTVENHIVSGGTFVVLAKSEIRSNIIIPVSEE